MRKKIGIVLTVILGISALGLGMFQSSASEASPSMDRQEIEDVINAQYPGEITELELDKKGSRAVYEAEIQDGNTEYEIKLDGNTGDVLELEEKFVAKDNHKQNGQNSADSNDEKSDQTDNDQNKSNQNNGESARNDDNADDNGKNSSDNDNTDRMELNRQDNSDDKKETGNQAVISTAEAEEIALNEFSGTITELELDEDDGRLYYEIELKSKNKEAEIEIDAYTSDILVMEIDSEDDDDDDDDGDDRYDD